MNDSLFHKEFVKNLYTSQNRFSLHHKLMYIDSPPQETSADRKTNKKSGREQFSLVGATSFLEVFFSRRVRNLF